MIAGSRIVRRTRYHHLVNRPVTQAYRGTTKVVPPPSGRTTSCIPRARASRSGRGRLTTASRLGDLHTQLGAFLHREGGGQRLMGDQIAEPLDIGHIDGRHGQH